jgi:hypothetical protein
MYENYENYTPESFNENFGMEGMDELSTFDPASPFARNVRASSEFQNRTKDKLKDAVITLRIQNKTDQVRTVELFNTIKHITKVPNTAIYGSVIKPLSISTIASALATMVSNQQTAVSDDRHPFVTLLNPLNGTAFFDDNSGNLVYNYSDTRPFGATNTNITLDGIASRTIEISDVLNTSPSTSEMVVSCAQMPYRQLVDNLGSMVLSIRQWKLQTSSENQIKQAFRPYLYGDLGVVTNDSFEPSEFFNPENQQTKLINMTRQMYVNKNTAVYIDVEPFEDMQLTLNVSAFRDNALGYLGGK